MDELARDEIEVRAVRLDRLGLGLSDCARAYVCNLPVFDELCDAIQGVVIERGTDEYIAGMKRVWAYLGTAAEVHAATVSEHPQAPQQRESARQIERAYLAKGGAQQT